MVLLYLNCSWHTDLDYCSYHLLDLEIGLRMSMIGRQRILTPPDANSGISRDSCLPHYLISISMSPWGSGLEWILRILSCVVRGD
jgi:hypothetical protein